MLPEASPRPAWCWGEGRCGGGGHRCQRHSPCPHLNASDFLMHLSNLDISPDSGPESHPPFPIAFGVINSQKFSTAITQCPILSRNYPCLSYWLLHLPGAPPNLEVILDPLFSLAPTSDCSPHAIGPSSPLPCTGPGPQHHPPGGPHAYN